MFRFKRCNHEFTIYLNAARYVSYDDSPYGASWEYLHACGHGCGKQAWTDHRPTAEVHVQ